MNHDLEAVDQECVAPTAIGILRGAPNAFALGALLSGFSSWFVGVEE